METYILVQHDIMPTIYLKKNGSWTEIKSIFLKKNGTWVEILSVLFKKVNSWNYAFTGKKVPKIDTKPTLAGSTVVDPETLILTATSYHWTNTTSVSYNWLKSTDNTTYTEIFGSYFTATNPATGTSINYTYTVPQSEMVQESRNYFKFAVKGYNSTYNTSLTEYTSAVYIEMPRQVTNLSDSSNSRTSSSVTLTWSSSQYAGRQEIQYKLASSSTWTTYANVPSSYSVYTVSGLTPNSNYNFRIRGWTGQAAPSYNSFTGYYGNWSNTHTASTTAALPGTSVINFTLYSYVNLIFFSYYSANSTQYLIDIKNNGVSVSGYPKTTTSSSDYTFSAGVIGNTYTIYVTPSNNAATGSTSTKTYTVPGITTTARSDGTQEVGLIYAPSSGTTKFGLGSGYWYGYGETQIYYATVQGTWPSGWTKSYGWYKSSNGVDQHPNGSISTDTFAVTPYNLLEQDVGERIFVEVTAWQPDNLSKIIDRSSNRIIFPYLNNNFTVTDNGAQQILIDNIIGNIYGASSGKYFAYKVWGSPYDFVTPTATGVGISSTTISVPAATYIVEVAPIYYWSGPYYYIGESKYKVVTISTPPSGGGGCYAYGTKITMSNNTTKDIENLIIGDKILAPIIPNYLNGDDPSAWYGQDKWSINNISNVQYEETTVMNVKHVYEPRYVSINNDLLKVTHDHFIFAKKNNLWQFLTILDLEIGDLIYHKDLGEIVIDSLVGVEEPVMVVDIDVEPNDLFLANNIITHNIKVV